MASNSSKEGKALLNWDSVMFHLADSFSFVAGAEAVMVGDEGKDVDEPDALEVGDGGPNVDIGTKPPPIPFDEEAS